MGRIVIFTVQGCADTLRIESVLKNLDIPYDTINLTEHPERREDMLSLCDRINVPQVFFHEAYVGGLQDTLAFLQTWTRERYDQQIAARPDSLDERLSLPAPMALHPKNQKSSFTSKAVENVTLPNGSNVAAHVVMETLKFHLPLQTRRFHLTDYRNCFRGRDLVEAIQSCYGVESTEECTEYAQYLQCRKIVHHVCDDKHLVELNDYFFRLQCHHTPSILNSYCIWMEKNVSAKIHHSLVRSLSNKLSAIESDCTRVDHDGRQLIAYSEIPHHPSFSEFEECMAELQKIDLGRMDEANRTAFGINVYNLMIRYAFVKLGFPDSTDRREAFLESIKMQIGEDLLSFYDLEYGLLRGNQKPGHQGSSVPFGKKDYRLGLALASTDARIHFALFRGGGGSSKLFTSPDGQTTSSDQCCCRCGPVDFFAADTLDRDLQMLAEAFCERDENFSIDSRSNKVVLARTLEWFGKDLKLTNQQLLNRLLAYVRGDKFIMLQAIIRRKPKVVFHPFDWKPAYAETFDTFDPTFLRPNIRGLFSKQSSDRTAPTVGGVSLTSVHSGGSTASTSSKHLVVS